ncbi:MAG TPA: YdeI/OmpD-associated family protein [Blastocatellia bacterium]|nr:YdeI/OmpD-associated family protein [Blastocatellia bacterium]
MEITYFKSPVDFRKWLETHGATARELWVGFYKKGSGMPSITWPESVDQALCFGWIDGLRKTIDETRYRIRFSPRRAGSIWSAINIKRAGELIEQGLMQPAGLKAFEARKENRSGIYSYEQRPFSFDGPYENRFSGNKSAWEFFQAQSPSYRRKLIWWVLSAKTEETRLKRLAKLIEDSAQGRRL